MSLGLHPGFSDLWGSPPAVSSTLTLGFFCLFECIGIQFFNSLTCDLRDAMSRQRSLTLIHMWLTGMPCHARGHSHSYLGKQRISLGWQACALPTYLAWLQPINYNFRFVYIHVNIGKLLLVIKTLIKKYRAAAKLISNHWNCSLKNKSRKLFYKMRFKIALSKNTPRPLS